MNHLMSLYTRRKSLNLSQLNDEMISTKKIKLRDLKKNASILMIFMVGVFEGLIGLTDGEIVGINDGLTVGETGDSVGLGTGLQVGVYIRTKNDKKKKIYTI